MARVVRERSMRLMLAFALVLPCVGTGCFDLPEDARARVKLTVSGLRATVPTTYSSASVVVAAVFDRGVPDAGARDAGGADAGTSSEIERAIQWDGTDPMVFYVRVPEGSYAPVRVEGRVIVRCTDMAGRDMSDLRPLARGQSAAGLVSSGDRESELAVTLSSVALTCP